MAENKANVRKLPIRECVGCRNRKPKNEMIRVIRTEDGQILLDVTGKKNGRGAYLCKNSECLSQAYRQKGLERSLKIPISPQIYDTLKQELENE